MQITINTADILGDETTIRDEVIANVSNAIIVDLRKSANIELSKVLSECLGKVVNEVVSQAISIHIDHEFTDIDQYGRPGKTASVRERIADYIQSQCTFKNANYSSDMNAFSRAVKETVENEVKKFKSEFNSLVTKQVIEQSMEMAVNTLRSSLGLQNKK